MGRQKRQQEIQQALDNLLMRLGRHFRYLDAPVDKFHKLVERFGEGQITALTPMTLRGKQPRDVPRRFRFSRTRR